MSYIRDCEYEERILSRGNLKHALNRLLRIAWKMLVSFLKDAFQVSGRIQL